MEEKQLKKLLDAVGNGSLSPEDALDKLKGLPLADLGYARVDTHRCLRTGVPEVIYAEGKTVEQILGIALKLTRYHANIMATRARPEIFEEIREVIPDCIYHAAARIIIIHPRPVSAVGNIAVVCAGTSDIPVAEESAVTAETLGNRVTRIFDVGVAGIHRLLDARDDLSQANVAVVAAGMEGALPSVIGGMVPYPVIAVPTSVGYGASFGGVAALLGMLNSCASGVSVVNIDNGFGAGFQASLINRLAVDGGSGCTKPSDEAG